ncbi:MAG: hypothetical protein A3K90_06995 [Pelodictyon luteolum]|uniref:Ferric oxidoreductase domain-containing protein n=1 Tax=Pelodictyon luteolum TaxID=1100 RepID=A0A165LFG7_PELLU|nr:hypothetical protein [Pelodictyon luteolum]KZK73967.1 MAG: hypothetical protein A3K90_06995 [Pelodictyon luteolum]
MWQSILIRKALPLTASYLLLIVASMVLDYLLHELRIELAGRYLGVAGAIFFLLSFLYSARKNQIIPKGPLKRFLQLHCHAGWIATLLILVHSGIHFNALLPWAATVLMMIVTASGHVGQHLVRRFRNEAKLKKQQLGIVTPPDDALDRQLFWNALTVKALNQWRMVHMPLVAFLIILTLVHVVSILFFSNRASWM